jgi:hypothetical protein
MTQRATEWCIGTSAKRITIQAAQNLLNRVASWLSYKTNKQVAFNVELDYVDGRKYPIYRAYATGFEPNTGRPQLLFYDGKEAEAKGRLLLSTQNTHTLYAFALGVGWAHDMLQQAKGEPEFKPMNITLEDVPVKEEEPEPELPPVDFAAALEALAAFARRSKAVS